MLNYSQFLQPPLHLSHHVEWLDGNIKVPLNDKTVFSFSRKIHKIIHELHGTIHAAWKYIADNL